MRRYKIALFAVGFLGGEILSSACHRKPEPPKKLSAAVSGAISLPVLNQNTVGTITANDVLTALDASNAKPGDVPCVKNGILAFRRPGECGVVKHKPKTATLATGKPLSALTSNTGQVKAPEEKVCVAWVNNRETCTAWADKSFIMTVPTTGGGDPSHGWEMDVPSVIETREEEYGNYDWCNSCSGEGMGAICTSMACDPHARHKVTVDTCADKTRFLLPSLDGKLHCLKFKFGGN